MNENSHALAVYQFFPIRYFFQLMAMNAHNPHITLQNQIAAAALAAAQQQHQQPPVTPPLPGLNSLNPQELLVCHVNHK